MCGAGMRKPLVGRSPEAGMALQSCPPLNQGARSFNPCADGSLDAGWPWKEHGLEEGRVFLCREVPVGAVQKLLEKSFIPEGESGWPITLSTKGCLRRLPRTLRKVSPGLPSEESVADTINCPRNSKRPPLFFLVSNASVLFPLQEGQVLACLPWWSHSLYQ